MTTLYEEAKRCFLIADPDEKLDATLSVVADWDAGNLSLEGDDEPIAFAVPGRLDRPILVAPQQVSKRGFGSVAKRASLIHSLAHIELTAVNLAWDTIYRFRGMPRDYYADWVKCAGEESKHFFALRDQLRAMGFDYGDFTAHDELWGSAVETGHDLMDRMGIVHRVFEARALDVVPQTRAKFLELGDSKTASILTMIANEEIGHVSAGTRWFRYRCEQEGLEPDATFFQLLQQYLGNFPKGPFNRDARLQCGFSENELARLESEDAAFRQKCHTQ
ncbi:MAG: ferritin-like domain-containing protein [Sedimenticola sp.]|nr:ferritin-like domain-containing protein [Sedimenticola sp.]